MSFGPDISPINNDVIVKDCPNDTVSSVHFSPTSNFLVASSWNKEVLTSCTGRTDLDAVAQIRGWEVQGNGVAVPKSMTSMKAPVLCTAFAPDGSKVFAGGCDNTAIMWDLATGSATPVAQHAAAIKECFWLTDHNMLVTGSWDKTIKYWDVRSPGPAKASVMLPERVYCMDVVSPLMVVGTAERQLVIFDLQKPDTPFKVPPAQPLQAVFPVFLASPLATKDTETVATADVETVARTSQIYPSPLKFQSRAIACFPDKTGFALGSIEGRVAVQHIREIDKAKNFAFKCHRSKENHVYPVNCMNFHPKFGTFSTAGSDGVYVFWDKDAKQRLKMFNAGPLPITASTFNRDGTIFAYSYGYDWSKGVEYFEQARKSPNQILLHAVQENEIKQRPG